MQNKRAAAAGSPGTKIAGGCTGPGPATLDPPQPAMTLHTFQIVFFLAGGAVILALQGLKYAVEHRSKGKHNA